MGTRRIVPPLSIQPGHYSIFIGTSSSLALSRVSPSSEVRRCPPHDHTDMQRFQLPYNLIEIAEAQKYLTAIFGDLSKGNGTDLQDLYRRSLLVEPRQPQDHQEKGKDLFCCGR